MRYLLCALMFATAALAQNPPANPPTTSTDPTGKACTAPSVLNYIPSGQLFTCKNGVYTSSGGGAPSGAAGGYLSGTYPNPSIKYQWQNAGFTGIGPTSFVPTHTLDCYDATATTGTTICYVKQGASQTAASAMLMVDGTVTVGNTSSFGPMMLSAGQTIGSNTNRLSILTAAGNFGGINANFMELGSTNGATRSAFFWDNGGAPFFNFNANGVYGWSSSSPTDGNNDTGISRSAAGVVNFGNGTAGDFSGAIKMANVNPVPNPTTQSGTAGTASCSTGLQGTQKYTTCYLAAYANTSTAQTYAFPVAFATTPVLQISGGSCGTFNPTASASTLTLPANAAMTAESCNISVLGQ